jgi:hypothetical protein
MKKEKNTDCGRDFMKNPKDRDMKGLLITEKK